MSILKGAKFSNFNELKKKTNIYSNWNYTIINVN